MLVAQDRHHFISLVIAFAVEDSEDLAPGVLTKTAPNGSALAMDWAPGT